MLRQLVLMLWWWLVLRSLGLLGKGAVESHGATGIDVAIGKRGVVSRAGGELPWASIILVVLIEVDELLVPHEKITNVHVSILSPGRTVGEEGGCDG